MEIFDELSRLVEARHPTDDPSHDFLHVLRVKRKCEELGAQLNARMEILIPAALLHDIINVPKNHPDRAKASDMAAWEAAGILAQFNFAPADIEGILQAIREHSFSTGHAPTSLEAAILQDADRLDAIGAIGIARLFSCGTRLGSSFYHPEEFFAEGRPLADKEFMVDHFFTKLFVIAERMNTVPAKEEALRRAQIMREFLEEMAREVSGGLVKRKSLG